MRISVVVPAHNEAALIAETLATIPASVDTVIVVDDGSMDETAEIAQALGDPRITLVRHTQNLGVGAAISTGYAHAFDMGAEIAVVMAGDGQMDPQDLSKLVVPIRNGEADYVKGNRLGWPGVYDTMPTHRFLGNQVLSTLTRLATGLRIQDSQCGYTAISKRAAKTISLSTMWRGYGYPNDLLSLLSMQGLRVLDAPVRPVYGKEVSGIRWWHAVITIPTLLLRAMLRRLKAKSQLHRTLPSTSRQPEA